MNNYKESSVEDSTFNLRLIQHLLGWVMGIVSYEALMEVCVLCFAFLMIGWINFSNDDSTINSVKILVSILKWIGIEENRSYGTEDINLFLSKIIFVLSLVGALLHLFINKLLKINLNISRWWGLVTITMFFIPGLISCYAPTAKEGSQSIVPVLLIFLLFSFISYGRYLLFQSFGQWKFNRKTLVIIAHK